MLTLSLRWRIASIETLNSQWNWKVKERCLFWISIVRHQDSPETKWFTKPTDTGLMLNFHILAPTQYKRNVVEGTIHRINHTTTDWIAFHNGVAKAQLTFEQNGYPLNFMEILFGTLSTRFGMSQVQSTDRTQVRVKLWKRARNGAPF